MPRRPGKWCGRRALARRRGVFEPNEHLRVKWPAIGGGATALVRRTHVPVGGLTGDSTIIRALGVTRGRQGRNSKCDHPPASEPRTRSTTLRLCSLAHRPKRCLAPFRGLFRVLAEIASSDPQRQLRRSALSVTYSGAPDATPELSRRTPGSTPAAELLSPDATPVPPLGREPTTSGWARGRCWRGLGSTSGAD